MACEGRGGGRANRYFGERVERPVLGCKLRTLEASQLNVKLQGALYSTIDIRKGLGHGRPQGGGREGVQEYAHASPENEEQFPHYMGGLSVTFSPCGGL